MNKQKLKGLWIPVKILLDEQLSDKEKLIYKLASRANLIWVCIYHL